VLFYFLFWSKNSLQAEVIFSNFTQCPNSQECLNSWQSKSKKPKPPTGQIEVVQATKFEEKRFS
jgi:hypothetical protein